MKIFIKDININYEVSGVGAPLIFLHGWGLDLHTFDNLAKELSEDYSVYQIDLPGFGESDISGSYTIEEYANYINEFCLSLAIINPIIIGHSFGGRIAMMYASRYDVDKLILISSPGIKERFNLLNYLKIKLYKFGKMLKIDFNMGSIDYKNSKGYLKNVLVKAVNFDLSIDIKKIKCPTLLLYGKKDKAVPLYIGKRINNLISGSGLVVVDKASHFPYIERFRFCLIIIKSFLYGNKI